jgi:subtilisin-like proprotein convertase family protein
MAQSKSHGVRIEKRVLRVAANPAKQDSQMARNYKDRGLELRVDDLSGVPRLITGIIQPGTKSQLSVGSLSARALAIVAANPHIFGVTAADLRLQADATLLSADDQFLLFEVLRHGLVIEDASIAFRFKRGTLVQIVNQSFSEAKAILGPAPADPAGAVHAALEDASLQRGADRYRVVEEADGYRLTRVASYTAKSAGEKFLVQVDLGEAALFEVAPTVYHVNGRADARVYPRYYAETPADVPLVEHNVKDGTFSAQTDSEGQFSFEGTQRPKIEGFTGKRVHINTRSGRAVSRDGAMDGDLWRIHFQSAGGSNDKDLAQAMVYVHTQRIIEHARRYISSDWFERRLTANVNLSSTCNAHWDGSTINFYSGDSQCANTGLISDVVYHEWGHGLDDNTGGIADGAFSEGYGDIMSMLQTRDHVLGIGFQLNGEPVRDLEPDKVYPRDRGEVHAEGLIIGSTFWDLYKDLVAKHGAETADELIARYAYKVIYTARRYTEVYDALLVIDDDDENPGNGTPNFCLINKAFAAHGLAQESTACGLASVRELHLEERSGNGNGVPEPGEVYELSATIANQTPEDIEDVVGRLKISSPEGGVVLEGELHWDQLPSEAAARSSNALRFAIPASAPCGTEFSVDLKMAAASREAEYHGTIQTGSSTGVVQTSAGGLPQPIRDNRTTTATMQLAADGVDPSTGVKRAWLKFDITHTYRGDLKIFLVSPSGTQKKVFEDGSSSPDVHFDAEVTELFAGDTAFGEWKLLVKDTASRDEGTLDAVELKVLPDLFTCEAAPR